MSEKPSGRNIYRAGLNAWWFGGLLFVSASPLALFGCCGLLAVGIESWYFYGFAAVLGGLFVGTGCALPFEKLVVDERGIARIGLFRSRACLPFDGIEAWLVSPAEVSAENIEMIWAALYPCVELDCTHLGLTEDGNFPGSTAIFRLRGTARPVVISDSLLWNPSFDLFLDDVRSHIGGKEIMIEGLHLPSPKPDDSA